MIEILDYFVDKFSTVIKKRKKIVGYTVYLYFLSKNNAEL